MALDLRGHAQAIVATLKARFPNDLEVIERDNGWTIMALRRGFSGVSVMTRFTEDRDLMIGVILHTDVESMIKTLSRAV